MTDFGGFGNFGGGGTGFNFFNAGTGGQGGGSGPTGGGSGFNPTSSSSLRYPSSSSVSSSNSMDPSFMVDMPMSTSQGLFGGYHSPGPQQMVSQSSHQSYYAATATAADGYGSSQYNTPFTIGRQLTPSQMTQFYSNSDSHTQTYMMPKGLPPGVPAIKQEPFDPTIERKF